MASGSEGQGLQQHNEKVEPVPRGEGENNYCRQEIEPQQAVGVNIQMSSSKRESLEAQGPTLCFFCLDDLDKKRIGML